MPGCCSSLPRASRAPSPVIPKPRRRRGTPQSHGTLLKRRLRPIRKITPNVSRKRFTHCEVDADLPVGQAACALSLASTARFRVILYCVTRTAGVRSLAVCAARDDTHICRTGPTSDSLEPCVGFARRMAPAVRRSWKPELQNALQVSATLLKSSMIATRSDDYRQQNHCDPDPDDPDIRHLGDLLWGK